MNKELLFLLSVYGFVVACAVGWVMNLIDIAQTWVWPPDGELILRVIGVFVAPLGAFMGLFV